MTLLHFGSCISWVGYSESGFEGQQHILEEGEYLECSDWGGSELLSLRPILSVSTANTKKTSKEFSIYQCVINSNRQLMLEFCITTLS